MSDVTFGHTHVDICREKMKIFCDLGNFKACKLLIAASLNNSKVEIAIVKPEGRMLCQHLVHILYYRPKAGMFTYKIRLLLLNYMFYVSGNLLCFQRRLFPTSHLQDYRFC